MNEIPDEDDEGEDEDNVHLNGQLNAWCNGIATDMWNAYQIVLEERGLL